MLSFGSSPNFGIVHTIVYSMRCRIDLNKDFLLRAIANKGTSSYYCREYGNISKFCLGIRAQSTNFQKLGSSYTFPFRKHSKSTFGNNGDFGNLSREHKKRDPLGSLNKQL